MIQLNNVTKLFQNRKILDHVNFEFCNNSTYVIKGESGSGKTTLLNILAGYILVDEGHIKMDQALSISYLFQEDMLFSNLTVRENMLIKQGAINKKYIKQELVDFHTILEKVNIPDLADTKVAVLSGGEKQRVQLANILLSNPDVILMDEPTSKLDERNKASIITTIKNIFNGKLIIIVCHDNLDIYFDCTTLYLDKGNLIYERI